MNQPNPNPNANANPPTAAAIARMKEIFNDPSRSEDAIKCATKDELTRYKLEMCRSIRKLSFLQFTITYGDVWLKDQ